MVEVKSGNVLLKPSQRKRLMGWLKRAERLGERIGDFALNIEFRRAGRKYEVLAVVHDAAGDFSCRCLNSRCLDACRELASSLYSRLRDQRLAFVAA